MKKLIPTWLIIFLGATVCFISILTYSSRQVNSRNVKAEVFTGEASSFKNIDLSICLSAGDNALFEISIPCDDAQKISGKYKNYEWNEKLYSIESNNSCVVLTSLGGFDQYSKETSNTYSFPLIFQFYQNKTWIKEGENQDLSKFTNMKFPYLTTENPEYYIKKNKVATQEYDLNTSDEMVDFLSCCMCVELDGKEYFTINNTRFRGPYEGKSGIFEVLTPKNDKAKTYDSYVKLLYELPISSESSRKVVQVVSWEQENSLGVVYIENDRDLMLDVYSLEENKVIASGKLTTMDTSYEKMVAKEDTFELYTNSHYLCVQFKDEVQVFDCYDLSGSKPIAVASYESCKKLVPELVDSSYPREVFYDNGCIYFVSSYFSDKKDKLSNQVVCLIRQENGENIACMKYELKLPFYQMDRENDDISSSYIMDCQVKKGGIHVRN